MAKMIGVKFDILARDHDIRIYSPRNHITEIDISLNCVTTKSTKDAAKFVPALLKFIEEYKTP